MATSASFSMIQAFIKVLPEMTYAGNFAIRANADLGNLASLSMMLSMREDQPPFITEGTSGYHKENNHFRRREYQKKIEAERRGGYLFLCSNKKRRESSRSLSPRGGRKNKRKSSRSPLGRIVTRRKGIGGCRSSPVSSSSHTRASKAEVAVGANTPYYSPQDTLPSYDRTRRRCDECYLFRDHGFCKYGDRCKFYHDNTTATMPKSISTMRGGYRRRKRSNSRERRRMKSRDRSYDGRTVNFREISLFSTDRGGSGRKGDDMRRIRSRRTNNSKSDIYSINGNDHKNGDTRGEDKKNILHHNTKRIGNGLQPDYSSCTSTISPEIIKENVLAAASKRLNVRCRCDQRFELRETGASWRCFSLVTSASKQQPGSTEHWNIPPCHLRCAEEAPGVAGDKAKRSGPTSPSDEPQRRLIGLAAPPNKSACVHFAPPSRLAWCLSAQCNGVTVSLTLQTVSHGMDLEIMKHLHMHAEITFDFAMTTVALFFVNAADAESFCYVDVKTLRTLWRILGLASLEILCLKVQEKSEKLIVLRSSSTMVDSGVCSKGGGIEMAIFVGVSAYTQYKLLHLKNKKGLLLEMLYPIMSRLGALMYSITVCSAELQILGSPHLITAVLTAAFMWPIPSLIFSAANGPTLCPMYVLVSHISSAAISTWYLWRALKFTQRVAQVQSTKQFVYQNAFKDSMNGSKLLSVKIYNRADNMLNKSVLNEDIENSKDHQYTLFVKQTAENITDIRISLVCSVAFVLGIVFIVADWGGRGYEQLTGEATTCNDARTTLFVVAMWLAFTLYFTLYWRNFKLVDPFCVKWKLQTSAAILCLTVILQWIVSQMVMVFADVGTSHQALASYDVPVVFDKMSDSRHPGRSKTSLSFSTLLDVKKEWKPENLMFYRATLIFQLDGKKAIKALNENHKRLFRGNPISGDQKSSTADYEGGASPSNQHQRGDSVLHPEASTLSIQQHGSTLQQHESLMVDIDTIDEKEELHDIVALFRKRGLNIYLEFIAADAPHQVKLPENILQPITTFFFGNKAFVRSADLQTQSIMTTKLPKPQSQIDYKRTTVRTTEKGIHIELNECRNQRNQVGKIQKSFSEANVSDQKIKKITIATGPRVTPKPRRFTSLRRETSFSVSRAARSKSRPISPHRVKGKGLRRPESSKSIPVVPRRLRTSVSHMRSDLTSFSRVVRENYDQEHSISQDSGFNNRELFEVSISRSTRIGGTETRAEPLESVRIPRSPSTHSVEVSKSKVELSKTARVDSKSPRQKLEVSADGTKSHNESSFPQVDSALLEMIDDLQECISIFEAAKRASLKEMENNSHLRFINRDDIAPQLTRSF
eukprot:jgi/Bigna1/83091/fgenesh1_pg.102_\